MAEMQGGCGPGGEAGGTPAPPKADAEAGGTIGGAAPPKTSNARRTMSVKDVAGRMGVEIRTVRRWCELAGPYAGRVCPHDRVKTGNGGNDQGEKVVLSWEEVVEWCEKHNVGRPRGKKGEDLPVENGPVVWSVDGREIRGGDRGQGTGDREKASSNPESRIPVPDALAPSPLVPVPSLLPADDRASVRLLLTGLQSQMLVLQRTIELYARDVKAGAPSTTQIKQTAEAVVKLSQEIRQLDASDAERAKERGELVARSAAERVLMDVVDEVVSALETMRQEIGQELLKAGCRIGEGDARLSDEAFERVVAAAMEGLFARCRGSAAAALVGRVSGAGADENKPSGEGRVAA